MFRKMILPVSLMVTLAFGYLFSADCQNQGAGPVTFYQYEVSDTTKWHPEYFIIVYPDMQLTFKMPYEKDRSGIMNLLFQCKESGNIHLLYKEDKNGYRAYTLFETGKNYNAILLYDDGRYMIYNDIIFGKNALIEVDMRNLEIQPSDTESQRWLSFGAYDKVVGPHERKNAKNYTTVSDSAIKLRGYVFREGDDGTSPHTLITKYHPSKEFQLVASGAFDGYFEFELDDETSITFRDSQAFLPLELNLTVNCGLFIVLKKSPRYEEIMNLRVGR